MPVQVPVVHSVSCLKRPSKCLCVPWFSAYQRYGLGTGMDWVGSVQAPRHAVPDWPPGWWKGRVEESDATAAAPGLVAGLEVTDDVRVFEAGLQLKVGFQLIFYPDDIRVRILRLD